MHFISTMIVPGLKNAFSIPAQSSCARTALIVNTIDLKNKRAKARLGVGILLINLQIKKKTGGTPIADN